MKHLVPFLAVLFFCLSFYQPAYAHDDYKSWSADTTSPKNIKGVSYNKQIKKFEVRYADGSKEAIDRQALDERNIYYPGHPEQTDSILAESEKDVYEKEANVDEVAWTKHLDINLQTYLDYATKRGLRRGEYKVYVRFLVNTDGSLSNFSVRPNPGYKFLEFVTAIFSNGPKWNPAEQNGKRLRSFHTQPITFTVNKHLDLQ